MTPHEIKILRNKLHYDSLRNVFDAFILPVDELTLSPAEEKDFSNKAVKASGSIIWDTYDLVRSSFLKQADELLHPYKDRISSQELYDLKLRMYTRFMEGRIRTFENLEKQEHAKLPPIEPGENDFKNTEMAAVFAHLPPQPDIAAWLQTIDISWTYDRLHMVTWFSGQLSLGSGNYSRSRPNHSAKTTYERLLNPYSLLWIAAALGEDKDLVIRTGNEVKGYATYRAKCGVIRRAIPWKRIYELALPLVEKEIQERQKLLSEENIRMKQRKNECSVPG